MSQLMAEDRLKQSTRGGLSLNVESAVAGAVVSQTMGGQRFARLTRAPQAVECEISWDAGLLHQYYRLREDMFISLWGLQNFSAEEDAFDEISDIVIARMGRQCVGGSRLTFKEPSLGNLLPMEGDDFMLADVLPELPIADTRCVEVSRLAILPEFQNSSVMLDLTRQMIKRSMEKQAFYAFNLAPVPLARSYRKTVQLLGVKWNILNRIAVPDREEYEGIKMVLSIMDLSPLYHLKNREAQAQIQIESA